MSLIAINCILIYLCYHNFTLNLQINVETTKMVYFKYGLMASFLLSSLLLMKASIIDTNNVTDISIKLISPQF